MSNSNSSLNATLSLRIDSSTKKSLDVISGALNVDSGTLTRAVLQAFCGATRKRALFILRSLTFGKNKDSSASLISILDGAKGFSKNYESDTVEDLSFLDQEEEV